VRIPCEVLKQRLQAGLFDNVGDALIGTWRRDGPQGFFRGTGATLCREVPFYVAGTAIYEEAKKVRNSITSNNMLTNHVALTHRVFIAIRRCSEY
jgi:phosphatidylinositol phospholipase C delta